MYFDITPENVLKKYTGTETHVVIPEGVASIGTQAFAKNNTMVSLEIPDSVKSIHEEAFLLCKKLQFVKMPKTIQFIENGAFQRCESLESVILPEGLQHIQTNLFNGCQNLVSVQIPDSVIRIESQAFYGCSSLEMIDIPKSVTQIENNVFDGTPWLKYHPDEFVIVGDGVLVSYRGKNPDVIIPEDVKFLTQSAFYGNQENIRSVFIPETVTALNDSLHCDNLQEINISEQNPTYSSIDGVLYNKTQSVMLIYPHGKKLPVFRIPDSVKFIESYVTFESATKKFIIPETVETIGYFAFSQNTTLIFERHGRQIPIFLEFAWFLNPHTINRKDALGVWEFLENPTGQNLGHIRTYAYRYQLATFCYDMDSGIADYLKENIIAVTKFAIEHDLHEMMQKLFDSGYIDTENIDTLIDSAIEHTQQTSNAEMQILLMEYKHQVIGYADPESQFKL
ncbi:MAG: leucine-rich repeat protein [Oscillospiraceae bacterium]